MRALLHGLGPLLPGVEHRAHAAVGICWKNCWQDASPHGHPHTQRQRLDLDSGREDLDQSCLGLGRGQRHGQGLRWPDRGSPREAEVEMRVLERFGGQVELMRAARLASSAHDWQGQPETNPQRGHGGKGGDWRVPSRRDRSLGVHSTGDRAVLGAGWGCTSLLPWGSQAVNIPCALVGGVPREHRG